MNMLRVVLVSLASWGCASIAWAAEPVSFEFQAMPVVSVMQATYKTLLHRDYVISPDVLALDKRVSVSVKAVPADGVADFVDGLLAAQGVKVEKHKDGIYYVTLDQSSSDPAATVKGVARSGPGATSGLVDEAHVEQGEQGQLSGLAVLVKTFRPENRTVDFMVTVINAAFGSNIAKPAGQFVAIATKKERMDQVLEFAAQVDLLPRAVEVSASFVEATTSNSKSSGLSIVASILGAKVGAVVGSGDGAVTVSTTGFQMVLDALIADGRFKQVSNSRGIGDEAEKVNLTVGDETPTLQSTGKDTAGNAVNSIVYRSSGVILDVVPRVLGSGRLSLSLDAQVSSFKATTTGVTGSPTLSKRQIKTAVTVKDGDVLIIGGLESTSRTESTSGLSFLPRSWAAASVSDERTDLLLVLSAKTVGR